MTIPDDPTRGGVFAAQDPGDDDALIRLLLDAYAPLLRAATEEADDEAGQGGPQDDTRIAVAVAERLFNDETVLRFFPESAREVLGPVEEWRWCLPYVRCCWMFGWLVCRGCRDYRTLNHHLYRYWKCVRQALGRPRQPGRAEREDFEKLSAVLGQQYGEWLRNELVLVDLDLDGEQDDVLDPGRECCRDNAFTSALFDRLASPEAAAALLGGEAFEEHRRHPYFWLCRCWCQAAIRLGCCLACARTRREYLACIRDYQAALAGCLGPLHCRITGPRDCFEERPLGPIRDLGVTVTGTVAGAFFGGYTIEWRKVESEGCGDEAANPWSSVGVVYPGFGPSGAAPVANGTLGWIHTRLLRAHSYQVRVCPRSTRPGETVACCCVTFNLFKRFVWINRIGAAWVGATGRYDADAQLEYPAPPQPGDPPNGSYLVPVGCCVHVRGAAWVGDCTGRKIKCFTLRYAPGFLPGPYDSGFSLAPYTFSLPPVCYTAPDEAEKRAQTNEITADDSILTRRWKKTVTDYSSFFQGFNPPVVPPPVLHTEHHLEPDCWDTTKLPACLDAREHHCASGQYTVLLDVEDLLGNHYYDTQHAWIDNKPLHLLMGGIQGHDGCEPLSLSRFSGGQPCATPWPRNLLGTAFDEWIIWDDPTYPSNNFDGYSITITRNCGGPSYRVPITPDLVRWYRDIVTGVEDPYKGTDRVGEPGTRCPCDPPPMQPAFHGVLTVLDLRAFDVVCAAQLQDEFVPPAGFPLQRGQCCAYTIVLSARDKTVDEVGPGHCHNKTVVCAITVCNDLPVEGPVREVGPRIGDLVAGREVAGLVPAAGETAE
jgi:hypothetical protein